MIASFRIFFVRLITHRWILLPVWIRPDHVFQDEIRSVESGFWFFVADGGCGNIPGAMGVCDWVDHTQGDLDVGIEETDAAGIEQGVAETDLLASQVGWHLVEDPTPLNGRVIARQAPDFPAKTLFQLAVV